MKPRQTFLALLAILGIGAAFGSMATGWFVPWSFTKSVERFEGRFFRVVIDFDYKGEPQNFNFVVGCNVKITRYQDSSSSHDIGLIPAVYGRRMKDNHAVIIRPPVVCYGETSENKLVPEKFIPVITVYDNADTLDEGLAYVTEEAYHSPRSDLSLPVTRIYASNREEFDKDGSEGVPNLVTRELYWSKQGNYQSRIRGVPLMKTNRAEQCSFALRYRLSEKVRKIAAKYWPTDRPRYWYAKNYETLQDIMAPVRAANTSPPSSDTSAYIVPQPGFAPYPRSYARLFTGADIGIPTIEGRYQISSSEVSARIEPPPPGIIAHYPVFSPVSQRYWPESVNDFQSFVESLDDPPFQEIRIGGDEFLGFAFCWALPEELTIEESSTLAVEELSRLAMERSRYLPLVRGHSSVDGVRVAMPQGKWVQYHGVGMNEFFERDEYVFETHSIDLGIIGGDVR